MSFVKAASKKERDCLTQPSCHGTNGDQAPCAVDAPHRRNQKKPREGWHNGNIAQECNERCPNVAQASQAAEMVSHQEEYDAGRNGANEEGNPNPPTEKPEQEAQASTYQS